MKTCLFNGILLTILLYNWCTDACIFGGGGGTRENDKEKLFQFRLCVPDSLLPLCNEMVTSRKSENRVQCVTAPDKISCLGRIIKGEADWMVVEPELLAMGADRILPDSIVVTSQIRSPEHAKRDHRYMSVAVIRKSSGIETIDDLKGKRSCHTGYGRNAGWKLPLSYLVSNEQLNCTCNSNLNAVEHDLAAVADYFGPICLPGQWLQDKEADKKMKLKYPQLRTLCTNPVTCRDEGHYTGYEGSLRCLIENNGDVAWTKWDTVQMFFPLDIAAEYELLCRDGSRVQLSHLLNSTTKPCGISKRPWNTVILTSRLANDHKLIQALQDQITALLKEANDNPLQVYNWLAQLLNFNNDADTVYHFTPEIVSTLTPQKYLKDSPHLLSGENSCGSSQRSLRFCVANLMEMEKCNALSLAAIGQGIYPGFTCVLGYSAKHCTSLVSKGQADLVVVDNRFNLQNAVDMTTKLVPILRTLEASGIMEPVPFRYAVAVIRKEIGGQFHGNLSGSLKDRRSCHQANNLQTGLLAPLSVLHEAGEINGDICDIYYRHNDFISWRENPLDCLVENKADVAFMDHATLIKKLNWSEPNNFLLLCKDGTVTELFSHNIPNCHWGATPTYRVLARDGDQDAVVRENIRMSLTRAQDMFGMGKRMFKTMELVGPYYNVSNLILPDSSVGFHESSMEEEAEENMLMSYYDTCGL